MLKVGTPENMLSLNSPDFLHHKFNSSTTNKKHRIKKQRNKKKNCKILIVRTPENMLSFKSQTSCTTTSNPRKTNQAKKRINEPFFMTYLFIMPSPFVSLSFFCLYSSPVLFDWLKPPLIIVQSRAILYFSPP